MTIADVAAHAATNVTTSRVAADPTLTTLSTTTYWPKEDAGVSTGIADSPAWQDIDSVTITTGEDALYIVANLTYAGGYDSDQPDPNPVRAQFALEVDGALQQDTITGHLDLTQTVAPQVYKIDRGQTTYKEWDHRHVRRLDDVSSLNKNAGSVRIIYAIPVMEGSHTVKLVGRRVPRNEFLFPTTATNLKADHEYIAYQGKLHWGDRADYEESILNVFSHVLGVIKIGGWQQAGTVYNNDFAPDDIEDGDTLTRAALKTDRIDAAATALNGLKAGDIARGALRAEHLPSMIEAESAHQVTDTTDTTVTSEYTGFQTATGDNILQGNWSIDASANNIILILADVEVQDLNVASGYYKDAALGVFKLVIETASGNSVLEGTEVYVSSDVSTPTDPLTYDTPDRWVTGELGEVHDNVTLAWVGTGSELTGDVLSVRVYAQVWDTVGGSASTPSMEIKRRSLSLVQFRR